MSLFPQVLFLAVLAVPVSYLMGICCGDGCSACCCCGKGGDAADLEMEKMDKIYQEVGTRRKRQRFW